MSKQLVRTSVIKAIERKGYHKTKDYFYFLRHATDGAYLYRMCNRTKAHICLGKWN